MATPNSSSNRQQITGKSPKPATSLVKSTASAEREKAKLRQGRDRLETQPTVDQTSVRSNIP